MTPVIFQQLCWLSYDVLTSSFAALKLGRWNFQSIQCCVFVSVEFSQTRSSAFYSLGIRFSVSSGAEGGGGGEGKDNFPQKVCRNRSEMCGNWLILT